MAVAIFALAFNSLINDRSVCFVSLLPYTTILYCIILILKILSLCFVVILQSICFHMRGWIDKNINFVCFASSFKMICAYLVGKRRMNQRPWINRWNEEQHNRIMAPKRGETLTSHEPFVYFSDLYSSAFSHPVKVAGTIYYVVHIRTTTKLMKYSTNYE